MKLINTYFKTINIEELGLELLSKIASLLLLILSFIIFKKTLKFIFKRKIFKSKAFTLQDQSRQNTIVKLLQNSLNYSLYFILVYSILAIIGVPISSLLAGAGIAGLAIGLGAQGFLTDLVNGVFILIERQYDVGDTVIIQNITGVVTNLGIRTTQLLQLDGTYNYIPNRNITVVSNLSRGKMRAQIDLPIPFAIDMTKLQQLIEDVNHEHVSKHPEIIGHPIIQGPRTLVNGQVIYRIDITTTNGQQFNIYSQFYKLYQEALRQSGLLDETRASKNS
ncbi:mechanosensitive ion channel family protein [Streptococcus fryi]